MRGSWVRGKHSQNPYSLSTGQSQSLSLPKGTPSKAARLLGYSTSTNTSSDEAEAMMASQGKSLPKGTPSKAARLLGYSTSTNTSTSTSSDEAEADCKSDKGRIKDHIKDKDMKDNGSHHHHYQDLDCQGSTRDGDSDRDRDRDRDTNIPIPIPPMSPTSVAVVTSYHTANDSTKGPRDGQEVAPKAAKLLGIIKSGSDSSGSTTTTTNNNNNNNTAVGKVPPGCVSPAPRDRDRDRDRGIAHEAFHEGAHVRVSTYLSSSN